MSNSPTPPADEPTRIGRTRTWWHPLFAQFLSWRLKDGYEVRAEVSLGSMPVRVDLVLVRLESGQLSPEAIRDLPELTARLRRRTLIELKAPTDALEAKDWELLSAYAALFLYQETEWLHNHELSLIFVAPKLTKPFCDSLVYRSLSLVAEADEPGVHRIVGGMFETWVIETDEIATDRAHILKLFSHFVLRDRRGIMEELVAGGHADAYYFMAQQIRQFHQHREDWNMTLRDIQILTEFERDIRRTIIGDATPEERLDGLTPEERLEGMTPEERLEGMTPEERLQGLSPDELLKLKQLIEKTELP